MFVRKTRHDGFSSGECRGMGECKKELPDSTGNASRSIRWELTDIARGNFVLL